ncbi:unnamed protein product, partial [Brassica napus]
QFGRRKRWGEKISFKAWAKLSCALVVSVKQISGPLLLYDDRVYRWVSSSRTNQIVGGSPPRPNIESTVALLLDDDESNRRWLFSSTRNQIIGGFCRGGSIRLLLLLKSKDLKRNRDGVIEEHELQVKRLEDKITQLIRLVLLLPQALPLAMDQERRRRLNHQQGREKAIQIYFSLCINSIARRIGSRSNQSLEHGWIWGKVGRAGLEEASICLLNCGPTGSEALKNLVLGGVGSITIVDGSKVELGDLGNNFMVDERSVGQSKAKSTCEFLQELNDSFTLVIATQLVKDSMVKLDKICREANVKLVFVRSYGLVGIVRVSVKEHTIIDSKPDHFLDDLRLNNHGVSQTCHRGRSIVDYSFVILCCLV